jgi:N-acetyl-anhydromuramyl-L-alanine amidase AmpD
MSYDTELWPYIPARDQGAMRTGTVRLVVIHDMEAPELDKTAENIGLYFQHPDKPSSAHIGVDNNSIVQYVKDSRIAFGAPGANHDGIQVELAGYGSQTQTNWLDKYSIAMLALASDAVAQYLLKFSLPPTKLSDQGLLAGAKGIVGHDQVSRIYHLSTHTDPGPNFPWDRFMLMVKAHYMERRRA